ncbi:AMP-binding protein [Stigmatella sp. ncwal1]|uniref:AMP-binding protein n=1 Tax=Stigmatella ashevillensis TaxID=2995309 RepID=A0ABT5DNA1_9BACT|nr:AMP-binding protein [Stigmatella ashevillena]MDC0715088.1 AMP-binding protein [Stigmatella ashevillena]
MLSTSTGDTQMPPTFRMKMWKLSVHPIPSMVSSPVASFHAYQSAAGRASLADTHSRKDDRSYWEKSFTASTYAELERLSARAAGLLHDAGAAGESACFAWPGTAWRASPWCWSLPAVRCAASGSRVRGGGGPPRLEEAIAAMAPREPVEAVEGTHPACWQYTHGADGTELAVVHSHGGLELVRRERPTLFFGVPTFYAGMLKVPSAAECFDVTSVRAFISAGEALSVSLARRFQETFGSVPVNGLGSTEMFHICIATELVCIAFSLEQAT